MESDTATGKNRWLRLRSSEAELPEFDHILDLYWSGPERRISTLTTRIIAVNAVALIMLMVGIVFLGQYHSNLIEAKLQSFNTEIGLVSTSISEITLQNDGLDEIGAKGVANRFSKTLNQRIRIFNAQGALVADSGEQTINADEKAQDGNLYTIRVLKRMARFIIKLLPQRRTLPQYPTIDSTQANDYPDVQAALQGQFSLSAWNDTEDQIFLSGAAPLQKNGYNAGAVLLTRTARDIGKDIGDVWINILGAFVLTLIITVLLSIYLSGVIASPLRKLARAAEGVRKGKISLQDLPDFSHRNDEIGELSFAFREMTNALSNRMDSIERFAADVAHELKNPLTSLRSATETAAKVRKPEDKEKLMGIVRHDIERLDRLISDISHASRLDSELSRDVFERISLKEILGNLLDAYKNPLEREKKKPDTWDDEVKVKGINVYSKSEHEKDIFVMGHTGRLEQVFQNILGNALSFSPESGNINILIKKNNNRVDIIFEDQGPGIPENKINTIFDRFYSQRPDHEDYGKHSGLGLSICKQIITAMGGEIFAENIQNTNKDVQGARFIVRLEIA